MKIYLKDKGYVMTADFPMYMLEMQDILDRLGKRNDSEVSFRISEYDNLQLPESLCGKEFSADIYKLNLFAERVEKLENAETAAFRSLLRAYPDSGFEDMLLMTWGLDSVPVYSCSSLQEELGEAMIENDMVEELNELPDKYLEFLDREKIGRLCQDRDGGMFIDGYYCVPSCYEPLDINIEFGEPEQCFFNLLIAPAPSNGKSCKRFAQWLSLPCNKENLNDIAKDFNIGRVQDMICYDFRSALPAITARAFGNMKRIDELNDLALKLSELSHDDFVKLKAVMESEDIHEISDTLDCIERLSEYEFDMSVSDESEFGRTYLAKNLCTDFDNSVLEDTDLHDFGLSVLGRKAGGLTSYGAVLGRGQKLYSAITVQPEQTQAENISEDFEPEEDECEDLEMGGMT